MVILWMTIMVSRRVTILCEEGFLFWYPKRSQASHTSREAFYVKTITSIRFFFSFPVGVGMDAFLLILLIKKYIKVFFIKAKVKDIKAYGGYLGIQRR